MVVKLEPPISSEALVKWHELHCHLGFQEKVIFSSLNIHIRIDPKIEKDGRLRTIFLAKIWHALEYLHEIIQIYITHKRGEEALSQIQE